MKIQLRELNYHEEFADIEVDDFVTALILAAQLGRVEITRLLLENDTIDVNLASKPMQITPLIAACSAGNFEIVRLLIESGADVNKANSISHPPLYFCFIRLQEDTNIFENALICNKMATLLLQHGADVNFVVNRVKGKTILMEYCSTKIDMNVREKETNLRIIRFLVESGANTKMKSYKGKTAMDFALRHPCRNEVLEILRNTKQLYFFNANNLKNSQTIKIEKTKLFSLEGSIVDNFCSFFKSCK